MSLISGVFVRRRNNPVHVCIFQLVLLQELVILLPNLSTCLMCCLTQLVRIRGKTCSRLLSCFSYCVIELF